MPSARSVLVTGAAVLAAAGGGATLAGAASSGGSNAVDDHGPHTVNGHSEQALTGTTADRVRRVALAKVPGTVERLETNVDGNAPYEAHIVKSDGISALFAAAGAVLLLWLLRRFPRRWWLAGAGAVVAISVLFSYVSPVVLDPIFNKFDPLPDGALRSDVLDLGKKAGVDIGQVYRIDASRRTTAINAYVTGIGHTKRVVLYDNLIETFGRDQIDSIVAHELGHVRHRDVPRGLLWILIVAPAGVFLMQRLSERWTPKAARLGEGRGTANALAIPGVLFALALVGFAGQMASNSLSRAVERSADAHALNLTRDPAAFIAVERRLAVDNVSEPDPPGWVQILFGTHPTTKDRIGAGLTWSQEH